MSSTLNGMSGCAVDDDDNLHGGTILNAAVLACVPLLMLFPKWAGWLSGMMVLAGSITIMNHRKIQRMDWNFIAFCLVIPLSYAWNILVMGGTADLLDRPAHLVWAIMIYFLIRRYGLHYETLFYAACAAACTAFAIAMYESVYLGHSRVFGLGQRWNAVPFGNFSILFGFFSLSGIFVSSESKVKNRSRILLGVSGFACGLTASVLSGTRGGWIAVPFLILLCIFFNNHLNARSRRIILIGAAIFVIAVFSSSDKFRSRVLEASDHAAAYISHPEHAASRSTSTGIRLAMWQWGITKFLERPLTGIGWEAYKEERREAVADGLFPKEFERLANLHNELITSLALGGLPSAFALIAFWILGWRFFSSKLSSSNERQHYFALCGLITIVGTGIFSMTEGLFGTSPGTKGIMLAIAIPAGALSYCYATRARSLSTNRVANCIY